MITEKHVQRGRYMCYIKYTVQKRASRCKAIRQTDATPISPESRRVCGWAYGRCVGVSMGLKKANVDMNLWVNKDTFDVNEKK